MTQHAPQAQLCPDCETVAHALAEAGPPHDAVLKRCPHNAVIAVAHKRGGEIVRWQIEGPLTDKQADQLGVRLILTLAAAGMQLHDITRQ
jgi:hypothetical protein